jgi:DNA-directed RNA polymerase subunit RPC12/RpoP
MLDLQYSRNIPALAESHEIEPVLERESAASNQEPTIKYACKRCQAALTSEPEYEDYDWFLRCLDCGAKNLLVLSFQIIGWRR